MPALRDLLIDLEQPFFNELLLLVLRILFELERDARAFGQPLHRFHKIQRFVFTHESEDVAAFMAAEAMESLLARINVKTRRPFAMERAERGETHARALQGDHRRDDI